MDVSSLQFLGFALIVVVVYNLFRALAWRQAILLLANVAFLATISLNWKAYVPLAFFLVLGYASIRLMRSWKSNAAFLPLMVSVVLIFIYLKQYRFLPAASFLPFFYVTVGLSYIFFRVVHMIVDARDDALPDRVGVLSYFNYTLNFTTLIAGPIQLYPDFAASQLSPVRPALTVEQGLEALQRIAIGFFKLRVVSMILLAVHGVAVRSLSGNQAVRTRVLTAAAVVVLYPLYLYFNFSGYVDLMIGVARFLRLELPENFNRPFSSISFLEFWNRWHMTLSSWMKTYVYAPFLKALMERFESPVVEPFLGVIAFFFTFFLVGAWHGQTSEFLFFGILLGFGISFNKLYQILLAKALGRKRFRALDSNVVYQALSRGLTFTYFAFTGIWFWAVWAQMHSLAGALGFKLEVAVWGLIWLGSAAVLAAWEAARSLVLSIKHDGAPIMLAWPVRTAWALYLIVLAALTLSFVNVPAPVLYRIF
jgi:D-alanyl-lipoteichoic acid acyltransferase DltB (MBOAT superfamily)